MKDGIRIKLNGKELEPLVTRKDGLPYEFELVSGKEGLDPPDGNSFPAVWELADWLMIE